MRFPADRIGALRRGEITAVVRVSHGMRPSGYRVGHAYAVERVDDVRTEKVILDDDGAPVVSPDTQEPVTLVTYEREVAKIDEWVEVTARYREQLELLRPEVVAAAGFEELEDLIDTFRADFGGPRWQMVWVLSIKAVHDVPRFMARPDVGGATRTFGGVKRAGNGDYVGGPDNAIDDLEAIDEVTLARYAAENREGNAERERRRIQRWENLTLAEQVAWLEGADAQGHDVRRALARVRQDVEVGRKRLMRRAA